MSITFPVQVLIALIPKRAVTSLDKNKIVILKTNKIYLCRKAKLVDDTSLQWASCKWQKQNFKIFTLKRMFLGKSVISPTDSALSASLSVCVCVCYNVRTGRILSKIINVKIDL